LEPYFLKVASRFKPFQHFQYFFKSQKYVFSPGKSDMMSPTNFNPPIFWGAAGELPRFEHLEDELLGMMVAHVGVEGKIVQNSYVAMYLVVETMSKPWFPEHFPTIMNPLIFLWGKTCGVSCKLFQQKQLDIVRSRQRKFPGESGFIFLEFATGNRSI
jgi:hypothetical protein